jgi:activating signal cointegrator complex subunit 2
LVPELVTSTPILAILMRRAEESQAATESLKKRITALQSFKKGAMIRPKRLQKRKLDKGKGKQTHEEVQVEMHVHKMSQITQVQDLFPDLGAGFVSKCLDEYGDDVEQVVANLLSETLPHHLASADRSEPLSSQSPSKPKAREHHTLEPHPTPPQLPTRRNVFDDDEFDRLAADTAKISFGKKPGTSADEMLADRSAAPNKAAIMSALAAFDLDDDERDDTYDAVDVGGTVDAANQEADGATDLHEDALFRAYQMDEKVFDRDAVTRRGPARSKLRTDTGMTDETIEGWALMLARNPQQKRKLEAKYAFSGQQAQIERTAWRASPAGSGAEESDLDKEASRGGRGGGRGRGRGRGGGGGGRGRGGNVAGPTGEKGTETARKNKEANKGSHANHNRRNARAKKMARGGFAG